MKEFAYYFIKNSKLVVKVLTAFTILVGGVLFLTALFVALGDKIQSASHSRFLAGGVLIIVVSVLCTVILAVGDMYDSRKHERLMKKAFDR